MKRCWWCGEDPLYVRYHDEEWGKPVRDDNRLFENGATANNTRVSTTAIPVTLLTILPERRRAT